MNSIVLELQQKALDKDADVAELVRTALLVARKLGINDFAEWAELELRGYKNEELPDYRKVQAEVKAFNPYRGWVPFIFEDPDLDEAAHIAPCTNPIGELQFMLGKMGTEPMQLAFSQQLLLKLMKEFGTNLIPTRLIGVGQVAGVLEAVRNLILEWSLELERHGILGDGLRFSSEEHAKAASTSSIHISNFQGVLGDIHGGQIQIGDFNSINAQLEQQGVSKKARTELEQIVRDYSATSEQKTKASLAKRAFNWLADNSERLGKLGGVIAAWFSR
ncbi:MAG: hypothetical protein HS101_18470 [Planctomycetia bacterium]|nr:hypothetical protein [Planctomycetia bacterium]